MWAREEGSHEESGFCLGGVHPLASIVKVFAQRAGCMTCAIFDEKKPNFSFFTANPISSHSVLKQLFDILGKLLVCRFTQRQMSRSLSVSSLYSTEKCLGGVLLSLAQRREAGENFSLCQK